MEMLQPRRSLRESRSLKGHVRQALPPVPLGISGRADDGGSRSKFFSSGTADRLCRTFEAVAKLPRRKQLKILEVVDALVNSA